MWYLCNTHSHVFKLVARSFFATSKKKQEDQLANANLVRNSSWEPFLKTLPRNLCLCRGDQISAARYPDLCRRQRKTIKRVGK